MAISTGCWHLFINELLAGTCTQDVFKPVLQCGYLQCSQGYDQLRRAKGNKPLDPDLRVRIFAVA